ncbi:MULTISPECIES: transposase [unclassified Streptomyces]|uniref:transposase n=1 Tax=unclassified Streptomyces TaxID=2593676 RepID=UPI002366A0CC|nr:MULTISPECIES: transposase [unclassified Streptomyces]MDF3139830.1 transposase [Streptomyces sp. T21Q-yed]WDF41888.1 transposase [Streptomyces sp. T12]
MLRHRAQLVRLRTLLRSRIHVVLAEHGCDRMGSARTCWSAPGRAWLGELPLPDSARRTAADRLEVIDALPAVIDRRDAVLAQTTNADPRVKALTALPGIGRITALVMVAEIGDIRRFSSVRKLASWAGLTPTIRGSDPRVRCRRISRQGDPGGAGS